MTDLPFGGEGLGALAALVADDRLARRAAKDVLARMVEEGGDPAELVSEMGLEKVSDTGALEAILDEVLEAWPDKVAEYRGGRKGIVGMFVGEVMKASKGAADPQTVKELLTRRLDS